MIRIIFAIFLLLIMWSCDNRSYFYSPNGKKCLTFIEHESNPYYFYVVPGKWEKVKSPKNNYLIVEWSDVRSFEVNWDADKYRIAYPGEVENNIDTSLVDYSWYLYDDETVLIDGEKRRKSPMVEGYLIGDIIRGDYIEKRKQLNKSD